MFATQDKVLTCADCGQEFTFTAAEQQFYTDRGFSEPRRCASCRALRKAQRGDSGGGRSSYSAGSSFGNAGGYSSDRGGYSSDRGGYQRAEREMFTATCSNCGKEASVPFRPTSGKPVYCSDCFRSMRPQRY